MKLVQGIIAWDTLTPKQMKVWLCTELVGDVCVRVSVSYIRAPGYILEKY